MPRPLVSLEHLREVLYYDPERGRFFAIGKRQLKRKSSLAGYTDKSNGYRTIGVAGRSYLEHRLAWFYVTGEWPADQIDHINGVRDDNRFANLRLADRWINARNRRDSPDGKGPYHFSRFRPKRGKSWGHAR